MVIVDHIDAGMIPEAIRKRINALASVIDQKKDVNPTLSLRTLLAGDAPEGAVGLEAMQLKFSLKPELLEQGTTWNDIVHNNPVLQKITSSQAKDGSVTINIAEDQLKEFLEQMNELKRLNVPQRTSSQPEMPQPQQNAKKAPDPIAQQQAENRALATDIMEKIGRRELGDLFDVMAILKTVENKDPVTLGKLHKGQNSLLVEAALEAMHDMSEIASDPQTSRFVEGQLGRFQRDKAPSESKVGNPPIDLETRVKIASKIDDVNRPGALSGLYTELTIAQETMPQEDFQFLVNECLFDTVKPEGPDLFKQPQVVDMLIKFGANPHMTDPTTHESLLDKVERGTNVYDALARNGAGHTMGVIMQPDGKPGLYMFGPATTHIEEGITSQVTQGYTR